MQHELVVRNGFALTGEGNHDTLLLLERIVHRAMPDRLGHGFPESPTGEHQLQITRIGEAEIVEVVARGGKDSIDQDLEIGL